MPSAPSRSMNPGPLGRNTNFPSGGRTTSIASLPYMPPGAVTGHSSANARSGSKANTRKIQSRLRLLMESLRWQCPGDEHRVLTMSTQLDTVAVAVTTVGHFVGGRLRPGSSGRTGAVFNPATGQVTANVSFASQQETQAA